MYVKPVYHKVLEQKFAFNDAPKNKSSRCGVFEKEILCLWVSDNDWLSMQTGGFKLGKIFKLPSFMKYVYLLSNMFFIHFLIYWQPNFL